MNWSTTGATDRPVVNQALQRRWEQPSKLFPSLISGFDEGQRLTVIEVGKALPDTVEYFGRSPCKLHFYDFYSQPELFESIEDGDELTPDEQVDFHKTRFRDFLSLPSGTWIDLILFWDLFNYLDYSALSGLSRALKPYLHSRTRAHGFGVHNAGARFPYLEYGIINEAKFSARVREDKQPELHLLPQAKLGEALSAFRIDHGLLLPDGRLEMELTAS